MKWVFALMLCAASASWASDRAFRGTFVWGHEVESFKPCSSKNAYWVEGEEKTLQPLRDRTEQLREKRGKPYQPIYIEAVGRIDTKSKREGHAHNFDGLFLVRKVTRVSSVVPKGCLNDG